MTSIIDLKFVMEMPWSHHNDRFCSNVLDYACKHYITDLLISAHEYMTFAQKIEHDSDGRTEDNRPFFSYAGIRFIMVSVEDMARYRMLI